MHDIMSFEFLTNHYYKNLYENILKGSCPETHLTFQRSYDHNDKFNQYIDAIWFYT